LDGLQGLSDQERLRRFKNHIIQYLDIVHKNAKNVQKLAEYAHMDNVERGQQSDEATKRDLRKIWKSECQLNVGADLFDHALQASVMCTEHPLPTDTTETTSSTPDILSHIKTIIQEVEMKKARTNWERFSRTQTSHTGAAAPTPIDQAPPLYKKSKKRERCHGSRARSRRRQKWQRSRYVLLSVIFIYIQLLVLTFIASVLISLFITLARLFLDFDPERI
jgi:hypothetical protein